MNKRTLYTYKWNLKRKFAKLEEEEAGDAVGAIEAVEAGDAVENIPNNNKADSIECSNVNEGDIPCFAIDNEDVDLSFEENERSTKHKEISSILVELKSWAIRNNVPLNITTDLLKSLARSGITGLPATSRTLLGGHLCKAPSVREMEPGEFCYYGIQQHFLANSCDALNAVEKIDLDIGIDGLALFKSSRQALWPILGSVVGFPCKRPFVIGCFSGNGKPKNINDFLREFVDEVQILQKHGVLIGSDVKKFEIRLFTCDSPARAFVTGVQSHTGKNSCPKCTQKGVYMKKRVSFSKNVGELRTDDMFSSRQDVSHHTSSFQNEIHILESIGIKMVTQFPIDAMHLIDLGVTKKWLSLALNKVNTDEMNKKLNSLSSFLPSEFGRSCRSLKDLNIWKATEFRQFLLYTGIYVLKDCVSEDVYRSFLLLHTAVRLLSCPKTYLSELNVAQEILEEFVESFGNIFGEHLISFNLHGLLHLTDCARLYGPLDCFSAYKFENHMQHLKRIVRKPNQVLQQIFYRTNERKDMKEPAFREQRLNFDVNIFKEKDSYCFIKNMGPLKIVAIGTKNGKRAVWGFPFKKINSFFEYPLSSLEALGISVGSEMEENMKIVFEDQIAFKLKHIPMDNSNTQNLKKRILHVSQPYNDKENVQTNEPDILEITTDDRLWTGSQPHNVANICPSFNQPSTSYKAFAAPDSQNENTKLLHILLENQECMQHTFAQKLESMQEQINKLQVLCERQTVFDKMLRENLVMTKETFKAVKKLFGEGLSQLEEEMGDLLPVSTTEEMQLMESKLLLSENETAMKTYLISRKGNLPLDSLFRSLATDEILDGYNWDGRCGKQPLKKIKLFGEVFTDVYCNLTKKEYEAQIRKSVELAHNRSKQRRLKQQTSQ